MRLNCPSNSSNGQPDFHYIIPQASVLFWVIFPNCLMISQVESPLSYLVPIIALDTKNYINAPQSGRVPVGLKKQHYVGSQLCHLEIICVESAVEFWTKEQPMIVS